MIVSGINDGAVDVVKVISMFVHGEPDSPRYSQKTRPLVKRVHREGIGYTSEPDCG